MNDHNIKERRKSVYVSKSEKLKLSRIEIYIENTRQSFHTRPLGTGSKSCQRQHTLYSSSWEPNGSKV